MSDNTVPHSPVFPAGKKWELKRKDNLFESDATALLRRLMEDESILADQRAAWERWRNDPSGLRR